ncbi:MAG TPA: type II CAAX endopeptidase family protein [Armatimonadota bacterium]|nr:type II CAAX endopeptidase family protein [Armatimonadota bacterium]
MHSVASGTPQRAAAASGAAGASTAAAAGSARPKLPGWLSGLLYLIGFIILISVTQTVMVQVLLVLKVASRSIRLEDLQSLDPSRMLGPDGVGLPLWSLIFATFTWASLLLTVGYTALMARWLERAQLTRLGLSWRPTFWRDLLVGIALATVLFVSVVGIGAGKDWFNIRSVNSALGALVITAVGAFILLPYAAVEEISMRGYLLHAAGRSWGRAGGVLASTLAFAGLHALNPDFGKSPLAFLGLLLAGFYLASAYLITGNLWLAIFIHTGWNLLEGPVFGLPVSGMAAPASIFNTRITGPSLWTGGSFGPEAGLLLCLLLVVHIAALWAMAPLLRTKSADSPPADLAPPAPDSPRLYRAIPVGPE